MFGAIDYTTTPGFTASIISLYLPFSLSPSLSLSFSLSLSTFNAIILFIGRPVSESEEADDDLEAAPTTGSNLTGKARKEDDSEESASDTASDQEEGITKSKVCPNSFSQTPSRSHHHIPSTFNNPSHA
jgi:hypothetical protein